MTQTSKSNMLQITLYEPISKDAVHWLLRNAEEYVEEKWIKEVTCVLCTTLKHFNDDGSGVEVKYHRKFEIDGRDYGRLYSTCGGFQMLWKVFRGALVRHSMGLFGIKLYDVDISNAHPNLFVQICRNAGISCSPNYVEQYIGDREKYLDLTKAETGCSREDAKTLYLSILNCGTIQGWMHKHKIKHWDEDGLQRCFATDYKKCFHNLVDQLMQQSPKLVEEAKESLKMVPEEDEDEDLSNDKLALKKRFVHILLTSAEDDNLMAACKYFNSMQGVDVISYQYDGCIIKATIDKKDINLNALRQHVCDETGYDINWEFKDFDETITIPAFCRKMVTNKDVVDLFHFENRDFFNDLVYDPVSGVYYTFDCGIWRPMHYEQILRNIQELATNSKTFALDENLPCYKSFWTNPKQVCDIAIRQHCLRENFTLKLDTSTTIFPFLNGCWDYKLDVFRPLKRDDMVSKSCGWNYEEGHSQVEVADFMEKLFPVEEERECVKAYMGYCINPSKFKKKAMMLTDTVRGNTGKSKLLLLMKLIMGFKSGLSPHETLFVENKQIFLRDTMNNKNSHSAVTAELKGCHLLCGDEMASSHKLDNVFCKDASGGTQALISGRHFHSKETFSFVVKFGMLLSFNQGCMPDLNQDVVLYERMLMAKCRTKFIKRNLDETDEAFASRMAAYEHCYEQDDNIDDKMMAWRSAAFDYFHKSFREDVHLLDSPPLSFIEFRDQLVKDDNVLTDWFEKHFKKTDSMDDYVQVSEINDYLQDSLSTSLVNSAKKRKELFEMCLTSAGFVVHDRKRPRGAPEKRKVAFGIKFFPFGYTDENGHGAAL